jgi:hypothetical protein
MNVPFLVEKKKKKKKKKRKRKRKKRLVPSFAQGKQAYKLDYIPKDN